MYYEGWMTLGKITPSTHRTHEITTYNTVVKTRKSWQMPHQFCERPDIFHADGTKRWGGVYLVTAFIIKNLCLKKNYK